MGDLSGDLATYSLADFVPFTLEVYARLLVRHNTAVWPAHVLTVAMGAVAIWAARRGHGRALAVLLAACWAWVGQAFHLERYATLSWAAAYFAGAFLAQAALVLLAGLIGRLDRPAGAAPGPAGRIALGLALLGLVAFPLLGPLGGAGWRGGEVFGIAPDPTAVVTMAVLVLAAPRPPWLLLVIPALWCAVTAATGWVVGAPGGIAAGAAALVALGLTTWKACAGGPQPGRSRLP